MTVDQSIKVSIKAVVEGLKNVQELEASVKKLQSSGGGKLGLDTGDAQGGVSKLAGGLRDVGANLANIKAGFDLVAQAGGFIFGLAKSAAELGSKFHDLSVQTGVAVETYSGLQSQLKQSGTDMDALARAAVFLQRNLGEAAAGNKELQRAFAALGIKDVRAALADTDGTLRQVVRALGQMESAGERNAAGSKVLGRGFKELSVFIADTEGNLDAVIDRARQAGEVMSSEAAAAADEFGDQLDTLTHTASVAGRSFGMELVPAITEGMADMTTSLRGNANSWREWGAAVASVIRGVRAVHDSQLGQDFLTAVGGILEGTNPVITALRRYGAQSSGQAGTGNAQDLANETARLRSKNAAAVGAAPAASPVGDFFAPGPKGQKARKEELDRLVAFAKEWDFVVSSVMGGKHNKGSLHAKGRAVDVDVRGKSSQEIEAFMAAARQAGFGVRDERVRPPGQKVWSNPHIHLTTQSKAVQAAVQAETKAFDEQVDILARLADALAEADLANQALTRSAADHAVAVEYDRLGVGKLTGEAAELGEALFMLRAEQIRSKVTTEEHAAALMGFVDRMKDLKDVVQNSLQPGTAVSNIPTGGSPLDLSNVQVDEWKTFREEWEQGWKESVGEVASLFSNFILDLRVGFGYALQNMLADFLQMVARMLAEAAAARLVKALFGPGEDEGDGGSGAAGGIISTIGSFFGGLFADGGEVRGPGTGTSDSILARLSNGEFVMRAAAVRSVGADVLAHINSVGRLPGFAAGGAVGALPAYAGAPGGNVYITQPVTIVAKDAQSFRGSEQQIKRELARAAQTGVRRAGSQSKG